MDETKEQIGSNLIVGRNAVLELLKSGRTVDKILIKDGTWEGSIKEIAALAKEKHIPTVMCGKGKLDKVAAGEVHQGVIACVPEIEYSTVDGILEYASERGEKPFICIADGINDPHNLGALIRCAEATGCHGLIIPKRRSVTLNATVTKSSAGAAMHLRVAKVTNLAATIQELKKKGLWIYAAEADGKNYRECEIITPAAFVFGSEGDGVSRIVKENCDFVLSIPMKGKVNSLNVSSAAAVILFHAGGFFG